MFTKVFAVLLIVGILFVIGCAAHVHKVGNGAQGNTILLWTRDNGMFYGV